MKKLLTVIMGALLLVNIAEARSVKTYVTAELNHFQLDRNLQLSFEPKLGEVKVDIVKKKINLLITGEPMAWIPEDPNRFYNIANFEFPLQNRYVDDCGTAYYVGGKVEGLRPPVAIYRRIEVRDNTRNHCPHFVPLAPTEVRVIDEEHDRRNVRITATSIMTGEAMH